MLSPFLTEEPSATAPRRNTPATGAFTLTPPVLTGEGAGEAGAAAGAFAGAGEAAPPIEARTCPF